jgi:hypothetical protein
MSEVKANKISPASSTVVTLGDSSDTFVVTTGAKLDINGTELILDADADTSITADTDDQIDIKIAGADDFRFTANNFNILSGSTLTVDSGATITNSGTATGFADFTAIGDGTVGSPSIANSGDTNTGVYFPAADTVGVVAGGVEKFRFGSNPIPGGSKNLIINGQMTVSQRGTSFTGVGTGTGDEYTLDRWSLATIDTSTARWTVSQEASGGTSGKDPWLKCLNTTADASPAAGEGQLIQQKMEGYTAKPLLGSSDGIIDGFTVSADMILYKDGGSSISFPATVSCVAYTIDTGRGCIIDATITSAATWQRVEFVFPADTSATFNIDNTHGFRVGFGLYAGTSRDAGPGSWFSAATNAAVSTAAENIADATNNYIGFTNVQLEVGAIPTSFAYEDHATILAKCQRYFWRATGEAPGAAAGGSNKFVGAGLCTGTTTASIMVHYPQPMRTTPTQSDTTPAQFYIYDDASAHYASAVATTGYANEYGNMLNFTTANKTVGNAAVCVVVSGAILDFSAEI